MKFDGPDALVAQLEAGTHGPPGHTSANETGPPGCVESMMRPTPSSRTVLPSPAFSPDGSRWRPATAQLEATWDTAQVWTDFEAALQRPERVLRLDLSRSKWKEVDHRLRRFRNLQELVLDRNRIDTLPDWLAEFQTLERLSLQANRIRTIPFLLALSALRELNLSQTMRSRAFPKTSMPWRTSTPHPLVQHDRPLPLP